MSFSLDGGTTMIYAGEGTVCLDLSSCYTLSLYDSWGDGWGPNGSLTLGGESFTVGTEWGDEYLSNHGRRRC